MNYISYLYTVGYWSMAVEEVSVTEGDDYATITVMCISYTGTPLTISRSAGK